MTSHHAKHRLIRMCESCLRNPATRRVDYPGVAPFHVCDTCVRTAPLRLTTLGKTVAMLASVGIGALLLLVLL